MTGERIEGRPGQAAAEPRPRARGGLGIKTKLLLAFAGMAGMTVIAGAVAWYAFAEIDRSVTRITAESVPAMSLAHRLAAKAGEITASAPALMASASRDERMREQEALAARESQLSALVREIEAGVGPDSVAKLRPLQDQISANLDRLNETVERRLALREKREAALATIATVHRRLLEILEPMIDDSVFETIITSEEVTAQSAERIVDLVDGGVATMQHLLEISAQSNFAAGLLAEAASVSDADLFQPIQEQFIASAAAIERNLRALPETQETADVRRVARQLLAFGAGDESIFEVRRRALDAGAASVPQELATAVKAAHEQVLLTLTPIIDDAVFDLVLSSEQTASESREAVTELVDGGVETLRLLLTMRAEGNLAAGLLNEAGGIVEASRLEPLRERFTAATGRLERQIAGLPATAETNTLKDVTELLGGFGTGTESIFALRSRELAQMAAAQDALLASRQTAARLGSELADLVAAAQATSDRDGVRATDAITGGKVLLIVILVIAVFAALAIILFYVSPRVVRPLLDMTKAMGRLAAGDTAVEIPARDRTDEVGRMAEAFEVFRDTAIELHKAQERELREARYRLTEAIESISEGFSFYDADDRLIVCNRQYRDTLYPGIESVVAPGVAFETIIRSAAERGLIRAAKARAEAWVAERLAQHRAPGGPHEQQRDDGRWIRVSERKTDDGSTVAVYSDITDSKRREEELRHAKDAAETALEELKRVQGSLIQAEKMASLGQLTAGIAHEIKNPLNFVNNFADTSAELLEELSELYAPGLESLDADRRDEVEDLMRTLRSDLGTIGKHGRRADQIVKSMLMHAHDEAGEPQPTDLGALIEECLNLAYHAERARNPAFNISMAQDLDASVGEVVVFPQELTRVLLNLFGNSFYATSKRKASDGDDYDPELRVTTRGRDDRVEIHVRDNGTGMPPGVSGKLFTPFFTTKPPGEGTGLGLSLSYEIVVQRHGGTIEVESEEGAFTEFVIGLPRRFGTSLTPNPEGGRK